MAVTTYRALNWPGSPPTPITIAEMAADGDGGGNGNPITVVIIVSNSVALPPGSPMWITIGTSPIWAGASGVGSNGFLSATATIVDNDDPPVGLHYALPTGAIVTCDGQGENPTSIFGLEILAAIGGPPGTAVDIVVQVGYADGSLPTDDPPTGPPDGIFPPTNLAAVFENDHVHLTWLDNSDNETGFALEWSGVPATTWAKFATVPAGVTAFDDHAIESGEDYSYRVYAFNSTIRSIDSNIATTGVPLELTPTTGPIGGGTGFAITGNFPTEIATTVTFGGIAATDIEVTESTITGRTPAHEAGAVDVVITRVSSTTLEDAFTYVAGGLMPRIEVTAPQHVTPPLPRTVTIAATIVDDPEGLYDNATYAWEIVGGPTNGILGLEVGSPTAPSTTVDASVYEAGVYYLRVTATGTDVAGNPISISATAQLTMSSKRAPIVTPETHTTTYPSSVTVSPEVSDDGWSGDLTYAWSQVGGPGTATILSPTSRATTIQLPNLQGVYAFQLTASNDDLSGTGVIRIVQYADVSPSTTPAGDLTITINGIPY